MSRFRLRTHVAALTGLALLLPFMASTASAHPDTSDPEELYELGAEARIEMQNVIRFPSDAVLAQGDDVTDIVSEGPFAHVTKNIAVAGRGERLLPNATTDVWALRRHAYIGTFNVPCGTGEGFGEDRLIDDRTAPGVVVFDVRNHNRPRYLGNLPSVAGSRVNDIKVEEMNSGDILVHSNEPCAPGGPGGIEIYNVDDPANPVHQASIRLDELNEIVPFFFAPGALEDVGVHNQFLFTQEDRDYVSVVYNGVFHSFRTFDITDPSNPVMVNAWGAEELFDPGVGDTTLQTDPTGERTLAAVLWLLDGFGTSRNRFLHDITVNAEGTRAFLSNWDAGLVLLDITDITDPQVVSVALDPERGSRDGEVNSHAAWPSEDGTVVVETEEDFDWIRLAVEVVDGPLAGEVFAAFEDVVGPPPPRLADVGVIEAEAVWVGRGCDTDNFGLTGDSPGIFDPYENDPTGKIAVIRRGACTFGSKLLRAQDAGAVAVLIANNLPDQPGVASASAGGVGDIPTLFVSTAAGDAFEAEPTGNIVRLDPDEVTFDPWGGVRIWDYSDETNPQLLAIFDTVCSADGGAPICDPRGTYSVHNVIVERDRAYFSWYSDGVLVLDISDPANPEEVGRFHMTGPEFEEANGGIQDVWGIYKIPRQPWLYASDRNGGLYVLRELGAGSERRMRP
jgi:hypothetical protein